MADWVQTAAVFRNFLLATGKSADTTRSYVTGLRIYDAWAASMSLELEDADRPMIESFIAHQLGAVGSRYTVRNRLFALRCYYDMLLQRGAVAANPTTGLTVKRPRTMPQAPLSLSDQRRLVFGARTLRDEAMLMALIDTGMRIGELVSMRIERIRWDEAKVILSGKGDKERAAWFGDSTLALIRKVVGDRSAGPVWLTIEGRPVTRDRFRSNFDRIAKRQRVKAHPHQLRTTFANAFLKEGGDLGALQVAMGHSDISTTAHYARATSGDRALVQVQRLNLAQRLIEE